MIGMEVNEKNCETANQIEKLLAEKKVTIRDAYGILDFVRQRILYTSHVEKGEDITP